MGKINSQMFIDKFTKVNYYKRTTKSHKSDWKGGRYENSLHDDC